MTETQKISAAMDDICGIIDTLQNRVNDFESIICKLEKYSDSDADLVAEAKERMNRAKIKIKAFEQAFYVLNKYKD